VKHPEQEMPDLRQQSRKEGKKHPCRGCTKQFMTEVIILSVSSVFIYIFSVDAARERGTDNGEGLGFQCGFVELSISISSTAFFVTSLRSGTNK
jgi:hypothetical protein